MDEKAKRRPNIRFRGFDDDWQLRKLGDISERVYGNDGRMNLPTLTISAANGWMNQIDRFSGNIAGKEQKNYTLLHKGELSYNHGNSKLAKYGAVFSLENYEEALVPRVYHSFKAINSDASFIEYYFSTKIPDRELSKLISSGARMDGLLNISFSEFMSIDIKIPSLNEQIKISSHLITLDKLINLHRQELDLLKKAKRTLLAKMFPQKGEKVPELRFKGFTDDWQEQRLGDIAKKVTEKNEELSIKAVLTNSAEFGIIRQLDFFDKSISNIKNINGYYVVNKEDFVYNPRISILAPVGPINCNKLGIRGIVSPLYTVFRTHSIDNTYLEWFFKSSHWHEFMRYNGDSGARSDRFSIKDATFFKMSIPFTHSDEQHKIGSFFENLDNLITLHQQELDAIESMKKSLLKAMFI